MLNFQEKKLVLDGKLEFNFILLYLHLLIK